MAKELIFGIPFQDSVEHYRKNNDFIKLISYIKENFFEVYDYIDEIYNFVFELEAKNE